MTNEKPHIGPSGYDPEHIGYIYDLGLADCTLVHHALDRRDECPGSLEIRPPAGKKCGLNISSHVLAAPKMVKLLEKALGCFGNPGEPHHDSFWEGAAEENADFGTSSDEIRERVKQEMRDPGEAQGTF